MKNNNKYRDHSLDYITNRGLCLVSNLPGTITVEDHNKWHDLYYIDDNGIADKLSDKFGENICKELESKEHFYPIDVVDFALKHGLKIEYLSYTAICQMYIEDSGNFNVPEEYLPTYNNLSKVLVDGNYITDNINYCETFNLYPEHFTLKMCLEAYSKKEKEFYNYAMCIKSCGKFEEGEIYRIGKIHWTPLNCIYCIVLDINEDGMVINADYPDIDDDIMNNFIFIHNTNISSIEVIKKIFDLLHD